MRGEGSLVSPNRPSAALTSALQSRCPSYWPCSSGTRERSFIEVAPNAAGGRVRLHVDVPLLDPLGRVKSAQVLYTSGTAKFSRKKRPQPALSELAPPAMTTIPPRARIPRKSSRRSRSERSKGQCRCRWRLITLTPPARWNYRSRGLIATHFSGARWRTSMDRARPSTPGPAAI